MNVFEDDAEPGAAEDGAAAEVGPPDVAEALQQMQAAQEQMLKRLPAEEPEGLEYGLPDYDEDDLVRDLGSGYKADGGEDDEFDDLIQGRVDKALAPHIARMEVERRVGVLHELAEKYAELRDPGSLEQISEEAERMAAAYGRPDLATDPALIEKLAQAAAAQRAAARETPAQPGGGATLETNAGPSPPPKPEVDPQTKAYLDVITEHAGRGKNAFTR